MRISVSSYPNILEPFNIVTPGQGGKNKSALKSMRSIKVRFNIDGDKGSRITPIAGLTSAAKSKPFFINFLGKLNKSNSMLFNSGIKNITPNKFSSKS